MASQIAYRFRKFEPERDEIDFWLAVQSAMAVTFAGDREGAIAYVWNAGDVRVQPHPTRPIGWQRHWPESQRGDWDELMRLRGGEPLPFPS